MCPYGTISGVIWSQNLVPISALLQKSHFQWCLNYSIPSFIFSSKAQFVKAALTVVKLSLMSPSTELGKQGLGDCLAIRVGKTNTGCFSWCMKWKDGFASFQSCKSVFRCSSAGGLGELGFDWNYKIRHKCNNENCCIDTRYSSSCHLPHLQE